MNQSSSSKTTRSNSNDDKTESDELSPPPKRHCQTANSNQCLSNQSSCTLIDLTPDDFEINKHGCKSCGKQETLLKTFNCPSLHYFCLNCIFTWTQKHVQTKTSPICLVIDCGYSLKIEDLDDLPIPMKDHQILVQLAELKIDTNSKTNNNSNNNNNNIKPTNLRLKCDKCYLYIDQHNFYIHHNECLGRSLTIPCEICYCPVLINDYEQHMLICNNDDNATLAQFLYKHLQNPNIDEKMIKFFICSWQRKHRGTIDIYEIIEELNQTNVLSTEQCSLCKSTLKSDEIYILNCDNNHASCLVCYKTHLQNQMNNNEILTCHQCTYHLQDKDISECQVLTAEQILLYQNYQNQKILHLYHELYASEDTFDINPTIQQTNYMGTTTTMTTSSSSTTTSTNNDDGPRRKCELCLKQHSYNDIFVLNCNCKICYDCFAKEVNEQRLQTNELLICSLCRSPIKHNDLGNLRLPAAEIQTIQLYQQGKLFEHEHAVHFNRQRSTQSTNDNEDDYDMDIVLLNQQQTLPKYWTLPMLTNFARLILNAQSTEYKFVADKFYQSWGDFKHQPPPPTTLPIPPPATAVRPPVPWPLPPPPPPRPPQAAVLAPTNNASATSFPPRPMQRRTPIQYHINSTNNTNNAQITNPPPLPSNPTFGPMPYGLPIGTTSMVQSRVLLPPPPPPASAPSVPYLPPQMLTVPMLSTHTRPLPRLPMNNPVVPIRQPRTTTPINGLPRIIQIERIQNQRWYKQYAAHECEFRQKLGKQSEQWLFHGCDERSSKNIELECFNRSYAGQHAVAFGQGCYFARDSVYSHSFAAPDRHGIRRMFLARVLVGNTTQGNSTMRVAPAGFDTTGDGHSIFVTYHDSQAYAEYLISYR